MLMIKADGEWVPWRGEVINNTVYPLNIETLWGAEELAKIGLYVPAESAVPDGKMATEWRVEEAGGVPVKTPTLVDLPQPTPTLEDRLKVIEAKLGIA